MMGSIVGDIVGSVYEHHSIKTTEFPLTTAQSRFTDDTVLTCAVAAAILGKRDYGETIAEFAERHPNAGYGSGFSRWVRSWNRKPYGSFGNGSAMRVSPVGFAYNTIPEVLREARRSAEVTHDHPEGIKGAQAVALAVLLARRGRTKADIKRETTNRFGYDLDRGLDRIRPAYGFDVTCPGTVPEAIIAFLESDGYEDALRKAVSLGGDSDTLACITGGIAEAFYGGVPAGIKEQAMTRLTPDLRRVVDDFWTAYGPLGE